jgi:serine/threonine protein kinase
MEQSRPQIDLSPLHTLFTSTLSAHGYTYESEIGKGGQGVAYLCRCDRDGELYAAKIARTTDPLAIPTELLALQSVWNPHVINFYETFVEADFRFIVLEYCPGGSLHALIKRSPLTLDAVWSFGRQIVDALRACHSQGVAHLDVNPQNILIDRHGRAKLCGFGLARLSDGSEPSQQIKRSPAFLAPEAMGRVDYDPFKADVWSLGVTIYVMATGHLPWPLTPKEFFAGVVRGIGNSDPEVPGELLDVLRLMIAPDPAKRAALADICGPFDDRGGKRVNGSKSAARLMTGEIVPLARLGRDATARWSAVVLMPNRMVRPMQVQKRTSTAKGPRLTELRRD